jgi:large subunit ribosomal protein L18Ae
MVKKSFGKIEQNSLRAAVKQYEIVGRAAPTQKNPVPKIYKMKVFGKNSVLARSKFWYMMRKINKAKKSGAEILRQSELFDRKPTTVQNYAIWLRYDSRTDTHNMYKEYRDTTINGAVSQMLAEMSGRHRAQAASIQIMKTAVLKDSEIRRTHVKVMMPATLSFPVVRPLPMAPKDVKSTVFSAKKPSTYAQ